MEYKRNNHIDILLIDENHLNEFSFSNFIDTNIFILCETENTNAPYINTCDLPTSNFIYKYQSVESLLQQILQVVSTCNIHARHNTSNSFITGVYSPIKRCGRTSLSIALAQLYSVDSKTLFISFDEFADKYLAFENSSKNLSQLIFYFLENPSTFVSKISSVATSKNLLDIIPPANFSKNIREFSSLELMDMLELLHSSSYQNIVIDFSDTTGDILSILTKCDIVYAPTLDDYLSKSKYEAFINNAVHFDYDFYTQKVHKVTLPTFEINSSYPNIFHNISLGPIGNFATKLIYRDRND